MAEEPIEAARTGDLAAFERIVLAYQRPVYATALRLLGNREDAQDAAQETFVRLFRNLRQIDEARALSAWLYRVTVNVCRDIARKRRRETELADTHAAPAADPLADLAAAERQRIVNLAFKRLSAKERAAVVLRDLQGLPTREVARILGSAEVTVRSHLSAARLKLKKYIEGMRQ